MVPQKNPQENNDHSASQERNQATSQSLPLDTHPAPKQVKPPPSNKKNVLMVYGREDGIAKKVYKILKEFQIEPIMVAEDEQEEFLLQKYKNLNQVSLVIVILTADNFVYGKTAKPNEAVMQAPQNVILELGYWLGKIGRNKVFVLYKFQKKFQRPTNFFDIYYIPFGSYLNWSEELKQHLRKENLI